MFLLAPNIRHWVSFKSSFEFDFEENMAIFETPFMTVFMTLS